MELKRIHNKQILATSTNQGEIFNSSYTVAGITFRIGELDKLYKVHNECFWQSVIKEIDGLRKSLINYQSKEGLIVYSKKINNVLLVVAAGEIHRGLYQIYVEGLWIISDNVHLSPEQESD